MQKKGQGLPLTTIVIAILVVVVLVVIVAFFLGGTTGLTNTIKRVFFGTTAGTDQTLAVETCRQYCDQAETLPDSLHATSPYCKQTFRLDTDRDGEADYETKDGKKTFKEWNCYNTNSDSSLGVPCNIQCQTNTP